MIQTIPSHGLNYGSTTDEITVFSGIALYTFMTRAPMVTGGTFSTLRFRVDTAPGSGKSWTLALMVNGSASALSVTLSNTDTEAEVSASVTVSAGDTVHYKVTKSGSPSNMNWHSGLAFEADDPGVFVYGFVGRAGWNATAYSAPLYGEGFVPSATSTTQSLAVDGTITDWAVRFDATAGAHTVTYVLRKNGVDQDGSGGTPNTTLTFTGGTTSQTASFSLTVADGDLLAVKSVVSGTPSVNASATIRYESAAPILTRAAIGTNIGTSTSYMWPVGSGNDGTQAWSATEAERFSVVASDMNATGLMAVMTTAPGIGDNVVFTLRVNGADTALALTISGASTTGAVTGSVVLAPGDEISIASLASDASSSDVYLALIAGGVIPHRGCHMFGEGVTLTGTRAVTFGLDGDSHTFTEDGKLIIYGDFEVTGDVTMPGLSSGAPAGASYVTLGTDATLTSERVLTAGAGITLTDGGAGSTLTIAASSSGGGLVLLEQHTASSSAALDFTTAFTSAYDQYQVEIVNLVPASDATLYMRFSIDGGATYLTANYKYATTYVNDAATGGTDGSTSAAQVKLWGTVEASSSFGVSATVKLFSPLSATFAKALSFHGNALQDNGFYYNFVGSGFNTTTSAVDAVRVLFSAGNIASGVVRVYGLAK